MPVVLMSISERGSSVRRRVLGRQRCDSARPTRPVVTSAAANHPTTRQHTENKRMQKTWMPQPE